MSFTPAPSSAVSFYSGSTLLQAQPGVATTALVGASATNKQGGNGGGVGPGGSGPPGLSKK